MSTRLPTEPATELEQGIFSDDLQQIIIMQRNFATSALRKQERSPMRLVQSSLRYVTAQVAELLNRSVTLVLAGIAAAGLFVLLVSVFMFVAPEGKRSASEVTAQAIENAHEVNIVHAAENEPEEEFAKSGSPLKPPGSVGNTDETFILRIGSFRDLSNADRVVKSLQDQLPSAHTELAQGLYIVVVGPFRGRSEVERASLSVKETLGLVPELSSNLAGH